MAITYDVKIDGRGALLTISKNERIIFLTKLNPKSDRARKSLLERVGKEYPGLIDYLPAIEADLVQAAVTLSKPPPAPPTAGRELKFEQIEPWPEPVNGAELLCEITATIRKYLVLPPHGAEMMAVWAVFTWCSETFDTAPLLVLTSPEKRCGKTRALELLRGLVRRPLATASVSPAALFRVVEQYRPTLLIDEADNVFGNDYSRELVGLLNSGWRRGEYAIRCDGDDLTPRAFDVFGPKALAGIGTVPDTLADRGLMVRLERKLPSERVESFRYGKYKQETGDLRRKILRWVTDSSEKLTEVMVPFDLEELRNDRLAENVEPLLAIAVLAGGDWPGKVWEAVLAQGRGDAREERLSVKLLADLQEIFRQTGCERLTTTDIITALIADELKPWGTISRGKPISPEKLARMLRPFGISPIQWRCGGQACRGYTVEALESVFKRYLSSPGVQPVILGLSKQNQVVTPFSNLGLEHVENSNLGLQKLNKNAGLDPAVTRSQVEIPHTGKKCEPRTPGDQPVTLSPSQQNQGLTPLFNLSPERVENSNLSPQKPNKNNELDPAVTSRQVEMGNPGKKSDLERVTLRWRKGEDEIQEVREP